MPKPVVRTTFGPWLGVNSDLPEEHIPPDELLWQQGGAAESKNVDFLLDRTTSPNAKSGTIAPRTGTQKCHSTAFSGGTFMGLFVWTLGSGTRQTVVIYNGRLYYKDGALLTGADFTEITPAVGDEFSTTDRAVFQTFRNTSGSTGVRLYIASGGKVYRWTGTALTRIDGVGSVPAASTLASYHTRMFYNDTANPKTIVWSKIGDAEDCAAGAITDGGTALVDTLTNESITALVTTGRSLLIATETSISRFVGYSDEDIRIEQDTEGVSSTVGVTKPDHLVSAGATSVAVNTIFHSMYRISEQEAVKIGIGKAERLIRRQLGGTARNITHDPATRRAFFAASGVGSNSESVVLFYNMETDRWGVWDFLNSVIGTVDYVHAAIASGSGTAEFPALLIAARQSTNHFVYALPLRPVAGFSLPTNDAASSSGTGGTFPTVEAYFPPTHFGTDTDKVLRRIQATRNGLSGVTLSVSTDELGSFSAVDGASGTLPSASDTTFFTTVRLDCSSAHHAKRFYFKLSFTNSANAIERITAEAFDLGRP